MRQLLILFVLFLPLKLYAAEETFKCKNNAVFKSGEASELLQKTQAAYSRVNTLKAEFRQESFLSALEASENSGGEVYFTKPGRMKWVYRSPEEQIFLIIDQTMWFYQALDKQAVVDTFSKFLISDLPVAFILGLGDLSKSFIIEKACTSQRGSILFSLKPKPKSGGGDERLNRFELAVNSKTYLPEAAKIFDVASNVNTFYLEESRINVPIDEAVYLPEFPEGTDIEDRRRSAR